MRGARIPLVEIAIVTEADVVAVRQKARRIAELAGFDKQDQTRIATAVSEIARNAFEYAHGGTVVFRLDPAGPEERQSLTTVIADKGPGIADLDAILEGRFTSRHGMGVGLIGAKRLVDQFEVENAPGRGARVSLSKRFSRRQAALSEQDLRRIGEQLAAERASTDPLSVLAEQNRDLARSLDELRERQEELALLNRELEDTNRGVVALYAELDEKAEQLRQASELKTRFLANMSHEFRTPLNSIMALAHLLLDRVDGPLSPEQERQVGFIQRSAQSLSDLVNDLLDIAKVEAGKVDLRPSTFTVGELFGGLRGALKPLPRNKDVELIFEEPAHNLPAFVTDETKLVQILRNFISNALKFTLKGEVRVSAQLGPQADEIVFTVADTGIGIAPQYHERIFEEFAQIENALQRSVKGTGLGLPLSRRLAELLGGTISVQSALGEGAVFTLLVPAVCPGTLADAVVRFEPERDSAGRVVLIVDDEEAFRYALRQMIGADGSGFRVEEAADGLDGLAQARSLKPDAIVLDLNMPRLDGFALLAELARDPNTQDIPVLISSSAALDDAARARLSTARAVIAKSEITRESLRTALDRAMTGST